MLFDTHCHLDQLSEALLSNDLRTDQGYLTMSTGLSNWDAVSTLSNRHGNVYPAYGIHPWFVMQQPADVMQQLESLVNTRPVTALGEIGLDFSPKHRFSMPQQLALFESQLVVAKQADLPVSLHVVKAHNEMLALLRRYRPRGVVHGLGASVELAQNYLNLGLKIGVNSMIVRPNAPRYAGLVRGVGLDALVLETDAPNIMLQTADIQQPGGLLDIDVVVQCVAVLTGCTAAQVIEVTGHNAQQIFNF